MCISSPEKNSWSVIYRKNSGEDINITVSVNGAPY